MAYRTLVPLLLLAAAAAVFAGEFQPPLNLIDSGSLASWPTANTPDAVRWQSLADLPADHACAGAIWHEERDVRKIVARFAGGADVKGVAVQYWFHTWPAAPPEMPTIEDPNDDPWQGRWITARVERTFKNGVHAFTFQPLDKSENDNAEHLPGVNYRRTLKMRLLLPPGSPKLESLEMNSETVLKPLTVRIEFGCGEKTPAAWSGRLEVFNGTLLSAKPWGFEPTDVFEPPFGWKNVDTARPKGVVVELLAAVPSPAGSNDMTVVTVRATAAATSGESPRTFSFNTCDLAKGPVYVPDRFAMVTQADDPRRFADLPPRGRKIRDRIPQEPEQTYDRATREIPPLDPWVRQHGDKLYLPVAADASWQKFAVEIGGDVFWGKGKAKGAELARLQWPGDTVRLRLGTMRTDILTTPYYREDHAAKVSVAEDCLPIVLNRWQRDGLAYEQEAFATLLDGPLDPNDPKRSEQTPAVLVMQLRVSNPGDKPARAACVLTMEPFKELLLTGRRIYGEFNARRLLGAINGPTAAVTKQFADGGVVSEFDVPPGENRQLCLAVPFVPDLGEDDARRLESLDYRAERRRVAKYWRDAIDRTVRFSVPEDEFNRLARATVPHIHISATKDPKSGLYMAPAASFGYEVYANESCFQALMLDVLGDAQRAAQYLEPLMQLQGSKSFPGNYAEPHDGVFHGVRIDDAYDYTAYEYGLDHGTVLWALTRHYAFTRDAAWLKAALPHMRKAVEWIERQRAMTKKTDSRGNRAAEYGLLPAGRLEDNSDWGYWFSVNAYCVAGMLDMAAAMKDIGHPDAGRILSRAAAYRDDLRAAVVLATELAPVVQMRDGAYSPYVPTRVDQRFRGFGPLRVQYYSRYGRPNVLPCYRLSATREALYGPMILLSLQLFDPHEPIADWILDDWEDNLTLSSSGGFNIHGVTDDKFWFSQGGMVFQANLQNPILPYLYRQEAPAAIRGIYNGLVSCLYPDVHALTEEYRQWRHASGPFYKCPDEARVVNRIRDMLVLESGEDLLLAPGAPRRWLTSKEGIQVDRINSSFGPVRLSMKMSDDRKTTVVDVSPPTRRPPQHLWLCVRLPDRQKMASVEIDGKPWTKFDADRERIELPQTGKPMHVVIH